MAERSKSRASPYCTRKGGASRRPFSSPEASHSLLSSLSPPAERALTFLQSARERDEPVRCGKWSGAEDAYLAQLVALFCGGLLAELEPKTTLRAWLARMLSCCPMRVSKKQMHGRGFSGKTKFRRCARRLPRDSHRQLGDNVARLRAEFVRAWARDEAARSPAGAASVDDWERRLQQLVPTPSLAAPSKEEAQTSQKLTPRPLTPVEIRPKAKEAPLEPAPIPAAPIAASPAAAAATAALAPAVAPNCLDEAVSLGDWLMGSSCQWSDVQGVAHVGETRYTFCEDEVQLSVHLGDQQGVSMTRRTRASRVVIDFGTPSCWHAGEEPKRASFSDCLHWSDNDLVEDGALLTDSGAFGWDDAAPVASSSSSSYTTYSPPLNLL
ncbi:uncharacterized protein IUM83_12790 [Phytophthora cinnamomi]|uniref:uncharacterized protein n=1 Tax=Phytophthora cinnamomi TaxID=4785 RepID=UPI00355A7EAC|nr:hypothetical protein IUM83_12790 [Phytophthora cinnamomi]